MMEPVEPPRRGTVVAVLICALLGIACGPGRPAPPASSPGGGPTRAADNGVIAFARLDPDEAREGLAPSAQLVELAQDGGVRRLGAVVTFRSTPTWSPDGKVLAYVGPSGLETTDGDDRRVLVPCRPATCVGIGPPAWSPDGVLIAFAAELDGTSGLWTVAASGGKPSLVVGGLDLIGTPSFAPDDATIAVIADRAGTREIAMIDAATGKVVGRIAPDGLRLGDAVAWAPDGTTLAVAGGVVGGAEGIYLMYPDGSRVRLLTSCPDAACVDLGPAWSPDGSTIVFTRGRCDEPGSDCYVGDLFEIPAVGGPAEALTEGPFLDCCAAWQPVA